MRNAPRYIITLLLLGLLTSVGLSGCDDQGPAEEAGEEIDETTEDVFDDD